MKKSISIGKKMFLIGIIVTLGLVFSVPTHTLPTSGPKKQLSLTWTR
jgi:hypothetical protein